MLAIERKNLIIEKLQEEKKVVVSSLSEEFGVSEETIRRDLDKLEKEDICTKSYGGAVLKENSGMEMPFSVRRKSNLEGKKVIAQIISDIIQDGDHIYVDPSTTSMSILKELRDKRLTIITNSIEVLLGAADGKDWDVLSTGGRLFEQYMALVGPLTLSGISTMNADYAILSCKGLDMERGITDGNELFSQVKQKMIDSANKIILAVDHTKFDKVAFSRICDITNIDMIVTDQKPSDAWINFLDERGIDCRY